MSVLFQNQSPRLYYQRPSTSSRSGSLPPAPAAPRGVHRTSTESSNIIRLDNSRDRNGTDSKSLKSLSEISSHIRDLELGIKQVVNEKQPYIRKVHKSVRNVYRRLGISHFVPFLVITIYTFVGAAIIISLEKQTDLMERQVTAERIRQTRAMVEKKMEEIYIDRAFHNKTKRGFEFRDLLLYYEREIGFKFHEDTVWTFINAMYYCGTLYTTIGYGNIWPSTNGGRIFTMVYAVLGIPIVLTCLSDLGRVLFLAIHRALVLFDIHVSRPWKAFRRSRLQRKQSTAKPTTQQRKSLSVVSFSFYSTLPTDPPPVAMIESVSSKGEVPEEIPEELGGRRNGLDEEMVPEAGDPLFDEFLQRRKIMRIPVSVALAVTISWIFFCAALFWLWESDWSYFTAVYFIFISLSTIGLGDVTPDHPEYMIAVFYLVIVGLSLVSMSIYVIQHRLREIFLQLLMKSMVEYQQQLRSGQDQVGAATGVAQAWNKNARARLLMPLLSNAARQNVVKEFQEEARQKGLDLPPILENVDPNTGLPSIFAVAKEGEKEPHVLEKEINQLLQSSNNGVYYRPPQNEQGTQTECTLIDREAETDRTFVYEQGAQVAPEQGSMETQVAAECRVMEAQTETLLSNIEVQTSLEVIEQLVQTEPDVVCSDTQTELADQEEFGSQFQPDLMTSSTQAAYSTEHAETQLGVDLRTMETQTEVQTAPMMTQTWVQQVDRETQMGLNLGLLEPAGPFELEPPRTPKLGSVPPPSPSTASARSSHLIRREYSSPALSSSSSDEAPPGGSNRQQRKYVLKMTTSSASKPPRQV